MPRSDKSRQPLDKPIVQYDRIEAPALGYNQGDSGNTPNINHSTNLPMTDNKRAPYKSRVIFDK